MSLIRVSANQLTHCPEQLLDLPKLAWFAFSGNPFSQTNQHIESVPQIASSSFTLQETLGQGASGVISKAIWKTTQNTFPKEVAVKVFKGEVTSDGYPKDELAACLSVGDHPNLIKSLAQVNEDKYLALIMQLIPPHYKNLGLPPSLTSCTRDTFPQGFTLPRDNADKIIHQMQHIFEHLHKNNVCHGDLYAHNTLFDDDANIIFGDFGAATMYHMLTPQQQEKVKNIEKRALQYFMDDIESVCE